METDYSNIEQKQPKTVKGEIFEEPEEKTKTEAPKPKPVKKPPLLTRVINVFLGTDGVRAWVERAADDTWKTVIKPNIQKVVADAMHNMVNGVIYRDDKPIYTRSEPKEEKVARNNETIEYNKPVRATSRETVKPIIFDTRPEAEDALNELNVIIDNNGVVKVSEFYSICGVKGEWSDNFYGWYDIESARLRVYKDNRWILYMPKPVSI